MANRTQRWQGQGDSALSPLGQAQARAVSARLAGRSFDRVVASDLERADATARAIGRPYTSEVGFREFDLGAWEGLTREEVMARYPEQLAQLDAGEDIALGGGESYGSFCVRIDDALARLRSRMDAGEHALVVCHGGVIGALVSGALGLRGVRNLPIARVLNTSITELSYDDAGRATVHVFNDSLHLGPLELFPHPTELSHALALICDAAPDPAFGAFAAHYDYELGRPDFLAREGVAELGPLLAELQKRHPAQRVALSASSARILGWAGETVFGALSSASGSDAQARATSGRFMAPRAGALCHVGEQAGQLALLDYGISI
ncbi:MAG: phosphoglycerate mutase [Myxococcaceae bacterium]|nr:phosphoglycerate mutase [Myxococcaceae bacterium]